MTSAVLDASAVIAMVLGEPGGETVLGLLGNCAITTVNLAEVASYFARNGGSAADIHATLDVLAIERVAFDEALAYDTAMLVPITRMAGLSFGDRACIALAGRLGARAVTADRSWARIADAVSVEVMLIR
jgi:PIN domain nuclease of toxin-antitoxin system